ncbi:hypothetical protein K0I73_11710 [Shewanella mesophila]|uniref:hypothetical protein n=1 Tax=Shewanella mesophila TaxID=2864208 RepID=UPI001C65AEE9|nr:hypothetical protein [Shewanella mesophila]QYJ84917.1 hypothetical protein K0I73_11710 [Shewanella mesophila]
MQIKNIILLFLLFCLTACARSNPQVDDFEIKVEDKFQTAIKGDGIKLFTYKVKYAQLPTLEQPHMARVRELEKMKRSSNKKQSRNGLDLSRWTQQIELGLDKTINMTGYCRDGYIELSRIIELGRGEIRGECNDGASEGDIKKFAS